MGARISTNRKEVKIDVSMAIKKNTDIMINNRTETYTTNTNINQFSIVNKGTIEGGIDVSQKIDISKTIQAKIDANITGLMKDNIQNELTAQVDQSSKTGVGAAFIGLGVVTNNDIQNIKKSFEYAVNKVVTQNNIQSIIDKTININKGEILNEGTISGGISVNQNIAVSIVVINLINQVFSESNDFLVNNNTDLQLKQASETKFSGLETYALGASALISCLLCFVCMAILLFSLSPAGQESSVILANAGASRIR